VNTQGFAEHLNQKSHVFLLRHWTVILPALDGNWTALCVRPVPNAAPQAQTIPVIHVIPQRLSIA
jgi:hypothetical protein